jgi:RNA polymerase sigma factor (sigma-70 family)
MAVEPMVEKNAATENGVGVPAARLPVAAVFENLCEFDRELLALLVQEPPAYIDDESLHRSGAEVALFGGTAKFVASGEPLFESAASVVGSTPREGSTIPTLTSAEERALFLRLNFCRVRINEILERFAGKRLTALAAKNVLAWQHRVLEIRAHIVRMNLPLVLAMAKRTRLTSIDFNELVSEGNMALLRSVDKFDCQRGFKFSTYSCRAILKSFSRVAMRASRYRSRFPAEFDPALETDNYLEEKRDDVEVDCVEELKRILVQNLADLTEVEKTVIEERFALNSPAWMDPAPKTLEQVGSMIGVTKERVRQIQNKALKKIRVALEDCYLAA